MSMTPMTEWSDWDAENAGFECEPGVGLTTWDHDASPDTRWLSWDETIAFHAWLGKKIEEAPR